MNLCFHSSNKRLLVVSLKHILLLLTGDSCSVVENKVETIWEALMSSTDAILQHHNAMCIARSIVNIMSSELFLDKILQNLSQYQHGKHCDLVESESTYHLKRLQVMVISKQNTERLIKNDAFFILVEFSRWP